MVHEDNRESLSVPKMEPDDGGARNVKEKNIWYGDYTHGRDLHNGLKFVDIGTQRNVNRAEI